MQLTFKFLLVVLILTKVSQTNDAYLNNGENEHGRMRACLMLLGLTKPVIVQHDHVSVFNEVNSRVHVYVWLKLGRHKLARWSLLGSDRSKHKAILLLISGIEPNPGPNNDSPITLDQTLQNVEQQNSLIDALGQYFARMWDTLDQNFAHVVYAISRMENKFDDGMLNNDLRNDSIRRRVEELDAEIDRMEGFLRQGNMKFIGIDEDDKDGLPGVDKVLALLNRYSSDTNWLPSDIAYAYREGTKPVSDNQPRPLVVGFRLAEDKIFILRDQKLRRSLKNLDIKLAHDPTERQKGELEFYRKKGLKAYYKAGQLHVENVPGNKKEIQKEQQEIESIKSHPEVKPEEAALNAWHKSIVDNIDSSVIVEKDKGYVYDPMEILKISLRNRDETDEDNGNVRERRLKETSNDDFQIGDDRDPKHRRSKQFNGDRRIEYSLEKFHDSSAKYLQKQKLKVEKKNYLNVNEDTNDKWKCEDTWVDVNKEGHCETWIRDGGERQMRNNTRLDGNTNRCYDPRRSEDVDRHSHHNTGEDENMNGFHNKNKYHSGRYVDPKLHSDTLSYENTNGYNDTRSYGNTNGYNDTRSYGNTNGHSDTRPYGNTNGHNDTRSFGNTNGHSDTMLYRNTNEPSDKRSYEKTNRHSDKRANGKTNGHSDIRANGNTSGYNESRLHGKTIGHNNIRTHGNGYNDTMTTGKIKGYNDTEPQGNTNRFIDTEPQGNINGYNDTMPQEHIYGYNDTRPQGHTNGYFDTEPLGNISGYIDTRIQGNINGYIDTRLQGNINGYNDTRPQENINGYFDTEPQGNINRYIDTESQGNINGYNDTKTQGNVNGYIDTRPQEHTNGYIDTRPQEHTNGYNDTRPQGNMNGYNDTRPQENKNGYNDTRPYGNINRFTDVRPHSHSNGYKDTRPHGITNGFNDTRSHENINGYNDRIPNEIINGYNDKIPNGNINGYNDARPNRKLNGYNDTRKYDDTKRQMETGRHEEILSHDGTGTNDSIQRHYHSTRTRQHEDLFSSNISQGHFDPGKHDVLTNQNDERAIFDPYGQCYTRKNDDLRQFGDNGTCENTNGIHHIGIRKQKGKGKLQLTNIQYANKGEKEGRKAESNNERKKHTVLQTEPSAKTKMSTNDEIESQTNKENERIQINKNCTETISHKTRTTYPHPQSPCIDATYTYTLTKSTPTDGNILESTQIPCPQFPPPRYESHNFDKKKTKPICPGFKETIQSQLPEAWNTNSPVNKNFYEHRLNQNPRTSELEEKTKESMKQRNLDQSRKRRRSANRKTNVKDDRQIKFHFNLNFNKEGKQPFDVNLQNNLSAQGEKENAPNEKPSTPKSMSSQDMRPIEENVNPAEITQARSNASDSNTNSIENRYMEHTVESQKSDTETEFHCTPPLYQQFCNEAFKLTQEDSGMKASNNDRNKSLGNMFETKAIIHNHHRQPDPEGDTGVSVYEKDSKRKDEKQMNQCEIKTERNHVMKKSSKRQTLSKEEVDKIDFHSTVFIDDKLQSENDKSFIESECDKDDQSSRDSSGVHLGDLCTRGVAVCRWPNKDGEDAYEVDEDVNIIDVSNDDKTEKNQNNDTQNVRIEETAENEGSSEGEDDDDVSNDDEYGSEDGSECDTGTRQDRATEEEGCENVIYENQNDYDEDDDKDYGKDENPVSDKNEDRDDDDEEYGKDETPFRNKYEEKYVDDDEYGKNKNQYSGKCEDRNDAGNKDDYVEDKIGNEGGENGGNDGDDDDEKDDEKQEDNDGDNDAESKDDADTHNKRLKQEDPNFSGSQVNEWNKLDSQTSSKENEYAYDKEGSHANAVENRRRNNDDRVQSNESHNHSKRHKTIIRDDNCIERHEPKTTTTSNGRNDCSGGDDEIVLKNVRENEEKRSEDLHMDPSKDKKQITDARNIKEEKMDTDNDDRKPTYNDSRTDFSIKNGRNDKKEVTECTSKNKEKSTGNSKKTKDDSEYNKPEYKNEKGDLRKIKLTSKTMENAKCQNDFFISPLRPRTRSMTKMQNKDKICVQFSTYDTMSGINSIEENDIRQQEEREYLDEENKCKPNEMVNQNVEYFQTLIDNVHPEDERLEDGNLYQNTNFCQENFLSNDDHFTLKDDSFEEIIKQLPTGNDNGVICCNNKNENKLNVDEIYKLNENKEESFELAPMTPQNTAITETITEIQQSKTPVKQQQRNIVIQPIEKRYTTKPVKRLSLGATSIEFAKNKRLSLEMKKRSSTSLSSNGWRPYERRRLSLDPKTKFAGEKKPAKLPKPVQTRKQATKQSEITDTFRLRSRKESNTTNK